MAETDVEPSSDRKLRKRHHKPVEVRSSRNLQLSRESSHTLTEHVSYESVTSSGPGLFSVPRCPVPDATHAQTFNPWTGFRRKTRRADTRRRLV